MTELDAYLQTMKTKGSIQMSDNVETFCKIASFRGQVERTLQERYIKAGWRVVDLEITGPHGAGGCSGEPSTGYFKLSFDFKE